MKLTTKLSWHVLWWHDHKECKSGYKLEMQLINIFPENTSYSWRRRDGIGGNRESMKQRDLKVVMPGERLMA